MDDEDEEKTKSTAAALAEALTIEKLWTASAEAFSAGEVADLEALAEEVEAVDAVEDVIEGSGADRFIDAPLTPEEHATVAPFKLSKSELRHLVPKVSERATECQIDALRPYYYDRVWPQNENVVVYRWVS